MNQVRFYFKKELISINGVSGGAIELGETPQMAAIREIKEETGLDVEIIKLIGVYTDFDVQYPNGDEVQSICIAYELKVTGGELLAEDNETLELKYFALDNLPLLFCSQHEELAKDIKNKY